MTKLAFVFRSAPFGSSDSREGLDTLLAATAFCDEQDIAVYFMEDGVLNLVTNQQPDLILQKDHTAMFKLLDLYGIENRFVCEQSLARFGLQPQDCLINFSKIDRALLTQRLNQTEKLMVF